MNKLTVSLDAINANYNLLKNKFTGAECGAVVKANGYGLGAIPISRSLQKEGCNKFFVATLEEGIELRPHITGDIFVFHGVQKNEFKDFTAHKLVPVISNQSQLEIWPLDKPYVLHFDTGMTRLGFDEPAQNVLKPAMVMSHLACADEAADPKNIEQLENFKKIAGIYHGIPLSLCNSAGIFLSKNYHFDVARPGIALYGGLNHEMTNVVTLTAPIIQIHEIRQPRTVGYGAEYEAQAGDVIATIPLGYADGILRCLGGKGKVYCQGYELPIVGRVSMDLITVKINNLPLNLRQLGQMVEILGEKYNILDMAADAHTIEYEIITRLGNRFERIYT